MELPTYSMQTALRENFLKAISNATTPQKLETEIGSKQTYLYAGVDDVNSFTSGDRSIV